MKNNPTQSKYGVFVDCIAIAEEIKYVISMIELCRFGIQNHDFQIFNDIDNVLLESECKLSELQKTFYAKGPI